MGDVLTVIGLALAVILPLAGYSLRAAFKMQALRAEVGTWRASFEHEKARADALTRRDDEERAATLSASKMVDALIAVGVLQRPGPAGVVAS